MVNKKKNTVLLFSLCFLILLGLQLFYIYNSYRLQEKDLIRKAREMSGEVIAEMEKFTEKNEEQFVQDFWLLNHSNQIQKREIDSIRSTFMPTEQLNQHLDKLLNKKTGGTELKIAVKNEIYSIVDNGSNIELLTKENPIVFYQSTTKVKNGLAISEGKWNSNLSHRDTEKNLDEKYGYKIKSRASFQLMNLHSLVIRKIIPLCIISLLLLILIVYIFRKNIQNIEIQNKKIAQLHTTIDSITHELNTPITTMKFLLASKEKNDSEIILERQIQRLQNIVSSVHTSEPTHDLVTEQKLHLFIQQLKQDYPALQIVTTVHFEKNNRLSGQDLETILFNLVDNSFKYKATTVHLELHFNKTINFTISDNGMGIPKAEKDKIFEKYYRISRKENHEINGLGVGLHLVKTIVERNNGKIDVSSHSDKGVTFKISFPNEK